MKSPEVDGYRVRKALGFGYDSRTDDHKIVRIFETSTHYGAEVATLGTHAWRKIKMVIYMVIYYCDWEVMHTTRECVIGRLKV